MTVLESSRYRRSLIVRSINLLGIQDRRDWLSRLRVPADLPIRGLRSYEITQFDTWFTLGARFFGNSRLWWVLLWYNTIIDPFGALVPGNRLLVPSRNVVYFDVLNVDDPRFLSSE